MPEVTSIPGVTELMLVLLLIGVVSAGFTQLLKLAVKAQRKKLDKPADPSWWNVLFRAVPTFIGGASGMLFFEWPWGMFLGLTAGILSAAIYARARVLVKRLNVSTSEDED